MVTSHIETTRSVVLHSDRQSTLTGRNRNIQSSTKILDIPARTFRHLHDKSEALIFLGCGGNILQWANGVKDLMITEGVIDHDTFDSPFSLVTTYGRVDLVFPFAKGKRSSGGLAIWKVRFGDCIWKTDYLVNYTSHHL